MTDSLALFIAIALPWAVGLAMLASFLPRANIGLWSLWLGYSYPMGLVLLSLVVRVLDWVGIQLTLTTSLTAATFLICLGLLLSRLRMPAVTFDVQQPAAPFSPSQKLLASCLLVLTGIKLLTIFLELGWRPMFAWDAMSHWANQARIWSAAGTLVPPVGAQEWLALHGQGVYHDNFPHYPVNVPLSQLWVSTWLGRWDESLVNFPWGFQLLSLGLMFYGNARLAGVSALMSLVFCYFLLSLPLINTHASLGGYADLPLAVCYSAALMAFYQWSRERGRLQGGLALFFALACMGFKSEGLFWTLTFAPGLILVYLPRKTALLTLGILTALAVCALFAFPRDIRVVGFTLQELDLYLRPEALAAIWHSFTVFGSWHLLAYLAMAALLLVLHLPRTTRSTLVPSLGVVGTAVALLLFLFSFTSQAGFAESFTAVSRVSLHLAPALLFVSMLILHGISRGDKAAGD